MIVSVVGSVLSVGGCGRDREVGCVGGGGVWGKGWVWGRGSASGGLEGQGVGSVGDCDRVRWSLPWAGVRMVIGDVGVVGGELSSGVSGCVGS